MFTGAVISTLGKGEEINLTGFGALLTSKIEARKGHNPKTKEPVDIPARIQSKFRPGKNLKDACNEKK